MENPASSTSMHLIIWQKQPIGPNEREDIKKLQLDHLQGSKHGGMSWKQIIYVWEANLRKGKTFLGIAKIIYTHPRTHKDWKGFKVFLEQLEKWQGMNNSKVWQSLHL